VLEIPVHIFTARLGINNMAPVTAGKPAVTRQSHCRTAVNANSAAATAVPDNVGTNRKFHVRKYCSQPYSWTIFSADKQDKWVYTNYSTWGLESKKGLFDATQDENTVIFSKKNNELVDQIKSKIEELISRQHTGYINQLSPADEIRKYKELLDDGLITQEEFEKKKKQLLGL